MPVSGRFSEACPQRSVIHGQAAVGARISCAVVRFPAVLRGLMALQPPPGKQPTPDSAKQPWLWAGEDHVVSGWGASERGTLGRSLLKPTSFGRYAAGSTATRRLFCPIRLTSTKVGGTPRVALSATARHLARLVHSSLPRV